MMHRALHLEDAVTTLVALLKDVATQMSETVVGLEGVEVATAPAASTTGPHGSGW